MTTFTSWLYMGGYAPYVWSAYGAVFVMFVGQLIYVKRQKKQVLRALKRWSQSL
ncbi:MAG: heme exporter protein CcmD [Legionellaceae bacterium]|nr:heme exporter protein CcmD [Legionellaceae bacterium]